MSQRSTPKNDHAHRRQRRSTPRARPTEQLVSAGDGAPTAADLNAILHELRTIQARLDAMPMRWGATLRHYRAQSLSRAWRTVRRLRRAASRRHALFVVTDGRARANANVTQQAVIKANNASPSLYIQAPPGGFLYGWIKLTVRLKVTAPSGPMHPPVAHLVANVGRGFEASTLQRLRLTDIQGAPQDHHIVFFPPGLQALRLDLPSVPAHSSIEALSVHGTEITKQEATLLSLWQHRSAVNTRPQALGAKGVRLAKYCYKHGLRATIERLEQGLSDWMNNYQAWAALNGALSEADEAAIRAHIGHFRARPTFSILMPVYNTEAKILKEAIASVRSQLYPHWQLCIVDDASDAPHVAEILAAAAQADARICVRRRQQNGHICRASNDALDMAQGEFVVLFDHDDLLTPHALYLLAHELEAHPEAQILYSDEDKISQEQGRYSPYFKHDFDPDLLLGQNCVSHLGCYKTARVRAIGGFRVGYEGSQDHDLVLRASAGLPHTAIRHIPQVLYHWRAIEGSTATAATAKSYAQTAGLRAVQDHLNRQGTGAKACPTADPGLYRIRYPVPEPRPLVSVIIPTRDRVDLLRQCIDSLRQQTDYAPLEILVVDNDSTCAKTLAYLKLLAGEPDVQIIRAPGPFNYAAINNRAAALAKGDILCLLNNDIEAIEPGWLTEMVSHVLRPDVGVVGARLLYPDGKTIQHGGVILGVGGIASHAFQRETLSSANHFGNDRLVRRYSAVTGACLMVQKSVYEQVGGLDPALKVAYNDIDFCLRVGAKGLGVVWTPFATLLHHESASRGSDTSPDKAQRFAREQQLMQRRYGEVLVADPHYNPNLTLTAENFSLSLAPRYSKPWSPYL